MRKQKLCMRLDPSVVQLVDAAAKSLKMNRTAWLTEAITTALEKDGFRPFAQPQTKEPPQ